MPEIKLPVTFAEFVKNKKDAITYMAIFAMMILFGLLYKGWQNDKKDLRKQISDCNTNNIANAYTCKVENDQLRGQIVELITGFNEMKGEMKTLRKLGIIKE
jgi:hypothetical protein